MKIHYFVKCKCIERINEIETRSRIQCTHNLCFRFCFHAAVKSAFFYCKIRAWFSCKHRLSFSLRVCVCLPMLAKMENLWMWELVGYRKFKYVQLVRFHPWKMRMQTVQKGFFRWRASNILAISVQLVKKWLYPNKICTKNNMEIYPKHYKSYCLKHSKPSFCHT